MKGAQPERYHSNLTNGISQVIPCVEADLHKGKKQPIRTSGLIFKRKEPINELH